MGESFSASFAQEGFVRAYAEVLVPRLFAPWAQLLLDAVGPCQGAAVADIACGPGTATREAATRVGPRGSVTGCDFSPAMIAFARTMATPAASAPIQYKVSPAAPLDMPGASCDLLLCQQGLQFFPDPAASVHEMRRVLRRHGRVAIALWSPIERCGVYNELYLVLKELLGTNAAEELKKPFSWPGAEQLRTLLAAADFQSIQIEERERPLLFEGGVRQCLRTLEVTPFAQTVTPKDARTQAELLALAQRHLAPITRPDGTIQAKIASLIATATVA